MKITNIEIGKFLVEMTTTYQNEYNSRIFKNNKVVAAIMDLRSCRMGFCLVPHLPQKLSELEAIAIHKAAINTLK